MTFYIYIGLVNIFWRVGWGEGVKSFEFRYFGDFQKYESLNWAAFRGHYYLYAHARPNLRFVADAISNQILCAISK